MPSQKSTSQPAEAKAPQRQRGRERVAALLAAASAVFAEKGYDAATMTEIAARAGAPIGSLYQFFPNKAVLGDALLTRYAEALQGLLAAIEAQAAALPVAALAQALLHVLPSLKVERRAAFALIDGRADTAPQQMALRAGLRQAIAAVLRAKAPGLAPDRADAAAVTLLQMMKGAAALGDEPGLVAGPAALTGLTRAAELYLADVLA
ncbi:MAG: helix-turn-helix domain containing protein [Azospirillaceae bacterium]|nr:helix-turn-helix domain containing protein [Azospirillaceae bacterium]